MIIRFVYRSFLVQFHSLYSHVDDSFIIELSRISTYWNNYFHCRFSIFKWNQNRFLPMKITYDIQMIEIPHIPTIRFTTLHTIQPSVTIEKDNFVISCNQIINSRRMAVDSQSNKRPCLLKFDIIPLKFVVLNVFCSSWRYSSLLPSYWVPWQSLRWINCFFFVNSKLGFH